MQIALLHLVIDPACTVVFESIPAQPGQMQRPPRPPAAPLFGRRLWRQALLQGGLLTLAALLLVFWPGVEITLRRSLVFSLLLLAGGGLVALNGGGGGRVACLGAAMGLGLWLVLQALPGLLPLLGMAPLIGDWALPWVAGLGGLGVMGLALSVLGPNRPER